MLTIGALSAACGVPTSTIRFWERKGLLTPTARRGGGQRRYDEHARIQVGVLLLCQEAGMTLAEIQRWHTDRASDPAVWRQFVRTKLADIEENMAKLNHAHTLMSHALTCEHEDISQCAKFRRAVDQRAGAAKESGPRASGG